MAIRNMNILDINFDPRIGNLRHVMTYTIGAGKAFNMVLSHPDTTDPSIWDPAKAVDDMKAEFEGWDPVYFFPSSFLKGTKLTISQQTY